MPFSTEQSRMWSRVADFADDIGPAPSPARRSPFVLPPAQLHYWAGVSVGKARNTTYWQLRHWLTTKRGKDGARRRRLQHHVSDRLIQGIVRNCGSLWWGAERRKGGCWKWVNSRWFHHQSQGHHVVLSSRSLSLYCRPNMQEEETNSAA